MTNSESLISHYHQSPSHPPNMEFAAADVPPSMGLGLADTDVAPSHQLSATAATSDELVHQSMVDFNSPQPSSPKDIQLPPSPPNQGLALPVPTTSRPNLQIRGSSFPAAASPNTATPTNLTLSYRPRTQSPSRPQIRPQSSGGVPLMTRAHSSPGVDSSGRFITPPYATPRRPSSPLHAGRRRSPLRSGMEESYPATSAWIGLSIEPNIPENEELELPEDIAQPSPIPSYSNTFPRSRRRPTSPLHQSASAPSLYSKATSPSPSHSRSTSPSIVAQRYANEPYPTYSFSSASSMPSTPTSIRSRSPSISSLETIEDSPGAEEQAMLEEEETRQKIEDEGADTRRRSSLELRGNHLRSNKERKRWSVCGAERRADFSLEPIEE